MTVSEARAALPALLGRVHAGEEVVITRHGVAVAVVVRPDALRSRRADQALESANRVGDVIEAGRTSPLPSHKGLSEASAEELIAEVQAGRGR